MKVQLVGRKSILSIREQKDGVTFNVDIATNVEGKNKLTAIIYSTLSMYGLDYIVEKNNQSTYIVRGLQNEKFADSVIEDIKEAYIDWYKNKSFD